MCGDRRAVPGGGCGQAAIHRSAVRPLARTPRQNVVPAKDSQMGKEVSAPWLALLEETASPTMETGIRAERDTEVTARNRLRKN